MTDTTRRPPVPTDQLTVAQFAKRWHVSERTVRHWIRWQRVDVIRTRTGKIRLAEDARPALSGATSTAPAQAK